MLFDDEYLIHCIAEYMLHFIVRCNYYFSGKVKMEYRHF